MANHNVTFAYTSFTSARVFIDQPSNATASSDADEPAAAYVLYSSFRQPGSINPNNLSFPGTAVVQQLNAEWTNTLAQAVPSQQFGAGEGAIMFRRDFMNETTCKYTSNHSWINQAPECVLNDCL